MEKVTLNRGKSSPTVRGGSQDEEKTLKCSKRAQGNSINSSGCDGGGLGGGGGQVCTEENSGNWEYARDADWFGVSHTQKLEEHH